MNRRGFFRALAAAAILSTASVTRLGQTVARVVGLPVLVGDGIADDTDALQASFDGMPVEYQGEEIMLNGNLLNGVFRITAPLIVRKPNFTLTGGTLIADFQDGIIVDGVKNVTINGMALLRWRDD